MHKPLYCLREIELVRNIVHTLRYTKHNGFPVVAANSPCTCSRSLLSAPDLDCPVHLDVRRHIPNQLVGGSESLGFVPYGSTGPRPGSSLLPRVPSGYNRLSDADLADPLPMPVGGPSPVPATPGTSPTVEMEQGDLARPATPSRSSLRRRTRSSMAFCAGCMQQAAEGSQDLCPIHSPALPTAADDGAGVLAGLVLRSQLLLALQNGAFCNVRGRPLNESLRSTDNAIDVGAHALNMKLFLDAYPRAPNLEVPVLVRPTSANVLVHE